YLHLFHPWVSQTSSRNVGESFFLLHPPAFVLPASKANTVPPETPPRTLASYVVTPWLSLASAQQYRFPPPPLPNEPWQFREPGRAERTWHLQSSFWSVAR